MLGLLVWLVFAYVRCVKFLGVYCCILVPLARAVYAYVIRMVWCLGSA